MITSVFDCLSGNLQNPFQAFLQFLEVKDCQEDVTHLEIEVGGQVYYKNIVLEEVNILMRIIRKNWCHLQSAILNEATISSNELTQIRDVTNKCLKVIVESLKFCESDALKERYLNASYNQVKTLLPLILPTSELEKDIFLKLSSPSCSKERCPIYQYFHTFQEVHYYLLLYNYVLGKKEELKHHIDTVIKDLVFFSENGYKQNSKSAFVCNCNKNFWLILQVLCEKALDENSFWLIFNGVIENFNSEYILWLLQDVAELQAYDSSGKYIGASSERIKPNFILLESALKNALLSSELSKTILSTLKSIEPLVCNLWLKSAKIEVYQILWEYFSKRLNLSVRNNTNLSLPELVELIDTILWTPKDCQLDFELFLAMLSLHLNEHPYHWGKMKGRIYSQLGPNKLKDLNTGGIFNVLLLYLSLTKVNFEELSKRFLSLVDNLPVEKKQTQLIWSFYNAFVIRHLRENRDIEAITPSFIKLLGDASTNQKLFPLLKMFVKDLDSIMNFSTNFQLHQWVLINSWIHKYMTSCYYQDLITLLNVLLNTIEKANRENVWCDWEPTFTNYVYPALKYSRSTPDIIGTVAAKIAILSPGVLTDAFAFFNSDAVTPKVSANFLCVILENYPNSFIMSSQQESVALQSWIKFCLLTRDGYEELTRHIIKLDIIPQFIKNSIGSAKDPLCTFIECIGNDIKQHVQSANVNKLCEIFFSQVERWITQYFTQPENEAVVLRIYTCLGLAIFKIGPLLYDKHKSNCPFARLVSSLLLPTDLIMGKPLNAYILQSVKKTWHLFFEATVKLNSPNDAFIERILREMVVRYLPHFATVDSPMLKCFVNEVTAEVILDKISSAFFKQPTKEAESNIFKALRLINDFVQSTTSVVLLKLVVSKTLYGIFEVIMFHNQKNMATAVVTNIIASPLYLNVKSEFENVIILIAEKHLAFNSPNCFQLLGNLAKLVPNSVKSVTPRIKQHISNVERMRGVGYDKTLRLSMDRLEATLSKC